MAGPSTSADRRVTAKSLGYSGCCWVNSANKFDARGEHLDLLGEHASEKRTVHTL